MKKILFFVFIGSLPIIAFSQHKESGTEREAIFRHARNSDTMKLLVNKNAKAIKAVLQQYRIVLEKNGFKEAGGLFTADAMFYESDITTSDFLTYLNHLFPDFKGSKSIRFDGYSVAVEVAGNHAFTVETYSLATITNDNIELKKKGVATSVLKKIKGIWKIKMRHTSSGKS